MAAACCDVQLSLIRADMAPIGVQLQRPGAIQRAEADRGGEWRGMVGGDMQLRALHERWRREDPADHRQRIDRHVENAKPINLPNPILVGVVDAKILMPIHAQPGQMLIREKNPRSLYRAIALRMPGRIENAPRARCQFYQRLCLAHCGGGRLFQKDMLARAQRITRNGKARRWWRADSDRIQRASREHRLMVRVDGQTRYGFPAAKVREPCQGEAGIGRNRRQMPLTCDLPQAHNANADRHGRPLHHAPVNSARFGEAYRNSGSRPGARASFCLT